METATIDLSILLKKSRDGDTAAFAEIVRKFQSLISGLLFSATGDFHKSEDLAQEAFWVAWNKLGDLKNDDDFLSWLCTIARNLARRSFRKKSETPGSVEGKTETQPGPLDELLRKEQSELVWSAVSEIPGTYRETLILYYRSGQSAKDIAAATDSSVDAVNQRLVRARKLLKDKLETIIGEVLVQTAPGDAFTLGVMSAITGAAVISTSHAALAASTTAATAGTTAGTATGKTFTLTTLWAIFGPLALFLWCFTAIFASVYESVRNAPTLLTRRSRVETVFKFALHLGWLYAAFCVYVFVSIMALHHFFPQWRGSLFVMMGVMLPIIGAWCYFFISSQRRSAKKIKRILEYELGISDDNSRVVRYLELERCFYRSVIVNVFIFETCFAFVSWWWLWSFNLSGKYIFSMQTLSSVFAAFAVFVGYYLFGRFLLRLCRTKEDYFAAEPTIEHPIEIALEKRKPVPPWKKKNQTKTARLFQAWLLAGGCVAFGGWVTFLNWSEHPLGIILHLLAFVAGGVCIALVYRRIGNEKNQCFFLSAFHFLVMVLVLSLLYQDCGSLRWSTVWAKAMQGQEYLESLTTQMLMFFVATFFCGGTFMLLAGIWEYRKKPPRPEEIEREEKLREAIAQFQLEKMQAPESESDLTPQPFPRKAVVLCILYGVALMLLAYFGAK